MTERCPGCGAGVQMAECGEGIHLGECVRCGALLQLLSGGEGGARRCYLPGPGCGEQDNSQHEQQ